MARSLLHFARWLAWQLGELDRPAVRPPARITVISGGQSTAR